MNNLKWTLLLFLFSGVLLLQCKPEDTTDDGTDTVGSTPFARVGLDTLPQALPDKKGEKELRQAVVVGQIEEACQLISENWVRQNISGFGEGEIKMISRTSPDGNASACQCTQSDDVKQTAFVIGYRISAGNMQFIDNLMKVGMQRDEASDIPPYQEVYNLGKRAAFSRANGNLAWVAENGLYIYMYMYPQSADLMKTHFNTLYSLAPEINEVVEKYATKG